MAGNSGRECGVGSRRSRRTGAPWPGGRSRPHGTGGVGRRPGARGRPTADAARPPRTPIASPVAASPQHAGATSPAAAGAAAAHPRHHLATEERPHRNPASRDTGGQGPAEPARRPRPRSLEEQVYAEVVREGDTCFDIGANVGWIALFLARTAGAAGKVIAFEPVWPTYMTMCANIQGTINIKAPIFTVPFGVAEEEKTAILHVCDGRFEAASLARPDESSPAAPQGGAARYECRFMTIDGFLLLIQIWRPICGRSTSRGPSSSSCAGPRGISRPVTGR